jgi:CrcB protein
MPAAAGEIRAMRALTAVFAGGFIGAIARAQLAESVASDPARWPWATFVANVLGALALGYVATRLKGTRRLLLGPGLCGALTTFSTLQLELLVMLDDGRWVLAAGYALASVLAGLGAVALTSRIGRKAA